MDLQSYATTLATNARAAGLSLAAESVEKRTSAIRKLAALLRANVQPIVQQNKLDLDAAEQSGVAAPMVKRLMLDEKRIDAMAGAVDEIAAQPDPVGSVLESKTRKDGLKIDKIRVPIGSVLFVYESRPNVTTDAAALCLRSGNAVILRGGKEAIHTNRVVSGLIAQALESSALHPHSVQIVDQTDRALLPMLLAQDQSIDVVIPRGGHSLIKAVVEHATMPVLKHFDGNCHIYVDRATLDAKKVVDVIVNAKTSYPGGAVCNAVEHLLFHKDASNLVKPVVEALTAKGVEVRGDAATKSLVSSVKSTTEEDWSTEYLAFIVGIKVVQNLDEAIDHINRFGSHHTDAILSTDAKAIDQFIKRVDTASIMVNASTRLADGGEFGLGAEIGISTDKLHARGPMGAADLCTYKWVVTGDGHLR